MGGLDGVPERGGIAQMRPLRETIDRESLAARIGVAGDFIRVPQLARVLGISSNSIHAQMRCGSFPIPHRRVGNVIVVSLDDYVDWYRAPKPAAAPLPREPLPPEIATAIPEPATKRDKAQKRAAAETSREYKERMRREILAGMRQKGFKV